MKIDKMISNEIRHPHNEEHQKHANLPIYNSKTEIMKSIEENTITIITGSTGSGKSTQIPQFLFTAGYTKNGKIGITQPRRIAAIALSKRVAHEMKAGAIGELVGYSVRFQNVTSHHTKIKFLTDGMLLREALIDKYLEEYGVLVIDEAHERSMRTDILLGLLKIILENRTNLKIIVMSATLEGDKLLKFFDASTLIAIPGRQFPVTIFYTSTPEEDYVEAALITILQIHLKSPGGGILVFLPGEKDILDLCHLLKQKQSLLRILWNNGSGHGIEKNGTNGKQIQQALGRIVSIGTESYELNSDCWKLMILPIYSSLPTEEQDRVFERVPQCFRKIVVATNIAETSITIPGISYVVDCGLAKVNVFDAKSGMDSLKVEAISQASASQRSGRAGREGIGEAYRLFTEETFEKLEPYNIPEILNADLAQVYLELKAIGVKNPAKFPYVDPPSYESLNQAGKLLHRIDAVDNNNEITEFGKQLCSLPLNPLLSKLVLHSLEMKCTFEIISIVAMLNAESIFYTPHDSKVRQAVTHNRKRLTHPDGDHLTLLNVFILWDESHDRKAVCRDYGLNYNSMKRADSIRTQLNDIACKTMGFQDEMKRINMSEWYKIRQCLTKGCWLHTAHLSPSGNSYITEINRQQLHLHPSSTLFGRSPLPAWIIYSNCIETNKAFLRDVSIIEGKWLEEFVPKWFSSSGSVS